MLRQNSFRTNELQETKVEALLCTPVLGLSQPGRKEGTFPSFGVFRKKCYLAIEARHDPEGLHNFDKWRPYVFNEWKVETVPWPILQSIPPF